MYLCIRGYIEKLHKITISAAEVLAEFLYTFIPESI
jgi:hypothetical protein